MSDTGQAILPVVRPAHPQDAVAIHHLLKVHSDRGNLLPRRMEDIEINLVDFKIVEIESQVVACAALELFPNELGEVRSLAVDQRFGRLGLGSKLVAQLIDEAEKRNLNRLMALTYVPEFFHTLGFQTVPKATLPEKVWGICVKCYKFYNCDEIAVLRYL
jgi:amino-acid N-acetyltransferase